jgi:hypothetical protein
MDDIEDYDPNTAHPKIPYKGTYPNLHVTQRADGSQELRSLDPDNEAFFEVEASGNYKGHGPDGAEVSVTTGKKHSYHADGVSSTVDGHQDIKVSGSSRSTIEGAAHQEIASNMYVGGGGSVLISSDDSQMHHSSGDVHHTTEGQLITEHTGSVHHSTDGDTVIQYKGNLLEMITGEYGVNMSGGNLDIQLDSGKARLKVASDLLVDTDATTTHKSVGDILVEGQAKSKYYSASDIVIESGTKITLKVGSVSITITSSGIKADGGATIDITSSGIKAAGSRIDLN